MALHGSSPSKAFFIFCLFSLSFTIYLLVASSRAPTSDDGVSALVRPWRDSKPYHGPCAIGTFLASKFNEKEDDGDDDDGYYVSARTLIYQLLHAPSTKLQQPVPVVILVTKDVRETKRQRLRKDGAIVIEVEHMAHNMTIFVERWVEATTKLRLFDPSVVPYEKVLLMDTDMVLTRPIDAIFEDPSTESRLIDQTNQSELELGQLPETFTLAASPESLQNDHPFPFLDPDHNASYFNTGLLLYSPSAQLFQYYMELANKPELYYHGAPDQDLINYAHRWGGPMPWKRLHP